MKRKRFSAEQIIGALKQAQVGVPAAEVVRKLGISEQTFLRWKAKYAGLEIDQAETCGHHIFTERLPKTVPRYAQGYLSIEPGLGADHACVGRFRGLPLGRRSGTNVARLDGRIA